MKSLPPNLVPHGRIYGITIYSYLNTHEIRTFKSAKIRPTLGLKFAQFNIGLRWLKENKLIEKTGSTYSRWRVLPGVVTDDGGS